MKKNSKIGTMNYSIECKEKTAHWYRHTYISAILLFSVILLGCKKADIPNDPFEFRPKSVEFTKTGLYNQEEGLVTESERSYKTSQRDESAIYVHNDGIYALSDSKISKKGNTSTEEGSNFYGLNAAVLAEDKSSITMSRCVIISDAEGANGVFAYGEGSSITVDNCTIKTYGNSSRGVDGTYGGTVKVKNTKISTEGDHCAALASDRYESNNPPVIIADNCSGETKGDGSPGIYSTGTFLISNSKLKASGSEAAVIEGFNSIKLTDTDISGASKWGVMIYQSMSGDSSVGTGTFVMKNGSLTNNSNGPVFFVCNTSAVIQLENTNIFSGGNALISAEVPSDDNKNTIANWGKMGGILSFSASAQVLNGDVNCDSSSSIEMKISKSSTFYGAVNSNNTGNVSLTLDASSSWISDADSHLKNLSGIVMKSGKPSNIDAEEGTTIYCDMLKDIKGNRLTGSYLLSSGGVLRLENEK